MTGTALLSSPGGESVWSTPYAFWDEPLAPRLTRDLVGFLRAVGPFAGVLVGEAASAPAETLVLTPRLLRFQHYVSPSAPGITVSLELSLYEPATDTVRVRATYTETVPLADPGLEAAVEAQGEAVRRIFLRFIRDVGAPAA
ncbi:ABC-type transport auxiliary lipoprotein family protein [Pararhodospirillum photometricum]|uniref:ABC-type uncharacterized transport system auxiliary component-like n=1 Tax=Pararhodospirillum photometricum DSM 122 TaxID=1150469 RepID=H6SKN5_PARPM|nr:ABC-type transport auxiliary lipoprotein family protein [Pararhodospirillum photometricum]CCG08550.1 ABC-type uncharacterized transport system auxiliary component-like [Pararhodospirillum photometricum DSM 122]